MEAASVLLLFALIIPLTLDTFILSAALSLAGLPKKRRLKISLIFAAFEAIMPAIGLLIGVSLGNFIGQFAGYTAATIIGIAGLILLRPGDEKDKLRKKKKLLAHTRGLAIFDLGLSISLDELAIGISLGLLGIPIVVAMVLIGIQAFIASQLGLRLGGRMGSKMQKGSEKIGGIVLILVALFILFIKITGHHI